MPPPMEPDRPVPDPDVDAGMDSADPWTPDAVVDTPGPAAPPDGAVRADVADVHGPGGSPDTTAQGDTWPVDTATDGSPDLAGDGDVPVGGADADTGDGSGVDVATNCPLACPSVGVTRCEGEGLSRCAQDPATDCPVWQAPEPCPTGERCEAGRCAGGPSSCLLISEYLEGTGNNKALELVNCGREEISLEGWLLCQRNTFPPASPTACTWMFALGGRLAPGAVWSVCNSQGAPALLSRCTVQASSRPSFNGDDPIFLVRDEDRNGRWDLGEAIEDAFGTPDAAISNGLHQDTGWRRCNRQPYVGEGVPWVPTSRYVRAAAVDDFTDIGVAPTLSGCP